MKPEGLVCRAERLHALPCRAYPVAGGVEEIASLEGHLIGTPWPEALRRRDVSLAEVAMSSYSYLSSRSHPLVFPSLSEEKKKSTYTIFEPKRQDEEKKIHFSLIFNATKDDVSRSAKSLFE